MNSSTKTDKEQPSNNTNDSKHKTAMATSSSSSEGAPPKKKRPIQHLLAGGTAGFVESSICHPLDTIKTRMQLRRQNTLRGRALGSLRDVRPLSSARDASAAGSNATADARGALHREAGAAAAARPLDSARTAAGDGSKGGSAEAAAKETIKVKKPRASAAAKSSARSHANPLHDVGWKQRLPPASATAAAAEIAVSSASTKAAASTAASASLSTAAANVVVVAPLGPFGTARRIIEREGPLALYKGLSAVYTGIVPKMAIRFVSFEHYRDVLGGWYGQYYSNNGSEPATVPTFDNTSTPPPSVTFLAGLLAGLTEAICIVTPAEVCKIRMQSQYHSLMDPSQMTHIKYKNVAQTAALVVKEEGIGALYKGVVPTMLRQGCNQAVNFTVYNWSKRRLLAWKKKKREEEQGGSANFCDNVQLDHWQTLLLGGLSGGMGPLVNNPLDVVKTRMQKQVIHLGEEPKYKSLLQSCIVIAKEEGTPALWKGITPRLMRIMPGQAITFMTYEAVSDQMEKYGMFD